MQCEWEWISLAKHKTEGKMPKEQAGSGDSGRALTEHHQEWNPSVDICSRLQAVIDWNGFATKF